MILTILLSSVDNNMPLSLQSSTPMESKSQQVVDKPQRISTPAEIQLWALLAAPEHPGDLVRFLVQQVGASRQTVNKHIRRLVNDGLLIAEGKTRARRYSLRTLLTERQQLDVTPDLEEDRVWREFMIPKFRDMTKNVTSICHYGFTEMVNNVISHSESNSLSIGISVDMRDVDFFVRDFGVGIFEKIQREFKLEDPRHALLELSKGRLTTDPKHHSGEGIYFSSRIFNEFSIWSGNLFFRRTLRDDSQWLVETEDRKHLKGTMVSMKLLRWTKRELQDVLGEAASGKEEFRFSRTHVPISLVKYGEENLVSRSQAKRLLARFERFKEILLDFTGVDTIGQAFADEIFRVYRASHPEIRIVSVNTSKQVQQMIRRVSDEAAKGS